MKTYNPMAAFARFDYLDDVPVVRCAANAGLIPAFPIVSNSTASADAVAAANAPSAYEGIQADGLLMLAALNRLEAMLHHLEAKQS